MKRMYWIAFAVLCLFSNISSAVDLPITVNLAYIKAHQLTEKGEDELYFDITEYSNVKRPESMRVPMFPTHWLSRQLHTVKDVTLWKGTLKTGEEKKLVFTLMEQDDAPWIPDDLVGSVQLSIKNVAGKLVKQWEIPRYKDEPKVALKVKDNVQTATLNGSGGSYEVAFSVGS